jgi:hypothetical protein
VPLRLSIYTIFLTLRKVTGNWGRNVEEKRNAPERSCFFNRTIRVLISALL